MNCFQICIFAGDLATLRIASCITVMLWIAFKFVSLQEIWQHNLQLLKHFQCCELLSNLYLCRRFGNKSMQWKCGRPLWIAFKFVSLQEIWQLINGYEREKHVVNCFQICIFAGDLATLIISSQLFGVVNCFQICIFAGDLATLSVQRSFSR